MTTNIIFLADIGKKINKNEQKLAIKERALFYIVLIIIPTFSLRYLWSHSLKSISLN